MRARRRDLAPQEAPPHQIAASRCALLAMTSSSPRGLNAVTPHVLQIVMAGLDPAISAKLDVDPRVKPGDDGKGALVIADIPTPAVFRG
jgi:hypothetical protein